MKVQHIGLLFVLFFMVFVLINTGIAKAQTENKFGIIDVQKVLRMSVAAKKIRPQLEKLKNSFRKRIDISKKELRKTKMKLETEKGVLNPEAYAKKSKNFKRQVTVIQRRVHTLNRALDRALANAMGKIHKTIRQITLELAREKSLQFVVPKRMFLYFEPTLEVTSEVMNRLNKKMPNVEVTIPPIFSIPVKK